jgi:hypothetical protein
MLRPTALLLALLATAGSATAQAPQPGQEPPKPDTVPVRGKALPLSCSEWNRNGDGSWSNVGPLLVGEETVTSVTLRAPQTRILEEKCGNGAPAAAPASDAAKPHGKHKHGAAPPANGT